MEDILTKSIDHHLSLSCMNGVFCAPPFSSLHQSLTNLCNRVITIDMILISMNIQLSRIDIPATPASSCSIQRISSHDDRPIY